ncbi:hypothetical protein TCAL_11254 [Tigriopus californicus]|uniref:Sjoegren syndrome/scleroderma autoantigen 1 n=1 Tax=Tigriopus californicus TaxID=6832 RepID=A0A553NFY6_TIGCA|nr:protein ZNRD2-like [Tigriopus californicus]TRY64331.1 hypothetical protein TCAL_11254 [Tigriopus californicus]|eukprot:TCALIF_11254-PA protein Name:"Similar to Sssca1 Sjoegren syndrome/scleroderma autoantigen 1 homolog (Mus musculus)" AED:0.03 eAED:0.04 QI:0/-1/0/1/-1/1/1/0/209
MAGLEDNDAWTPPSEAEMKIIQAKRERSDKISKIIGQYLLKGYKMLATSCPQCSSIELEDKQGQIYCVACAEVDCQETSKDNPAISQPAARVALREMEETAPPPPISASSRTHSTRILGTHSNTLPSLPVNTLLGLNSNSQCDGLLGLNSVGHSELMAESRLATQAILHQMREARIKVQDTSDVLASEQYVRFMKTCADSLAALAALAK